MNWQAMGSTALRWALWNTAGAGVVFVVILIVLKAVGNRLSARARHNLWMLVALRLVLPAIPGMGLTLPRWPRPVVDAKTLPISYQTPSDSRAIVPPFTASVVNAPESVTTEEPPVLASVVSASQVAPAPESSDLAPLPAATDSISGPVAVSNHDQSSVTPTLAKDTRVTSIPKAPNAIPWRMWLMLMWLSGAAIAGSWLLGKIVQLWLVTRVLEPVKDQIALELIEECRVLVGLKRPPALVVGSPDFGPALVGFWRPRLFVPANVLSTFGRQELRVIFLHELVHQRRRDVAINYLIAGLQALHWFNPLVWMAFSKLRAERELACDEAVLKLCASRDRLSYGCTILKLLESACGNAGLAAGAVGVIGNQALIHRRIDMIARFDRSRQGRSAAAVVLSIIVGAAALGATSQAQDKPAALPPPNGASAGDRSMDSARATIEAAAKPAISANQSPVAEDPKGAARPEVGPVSPAVARPDRGIGNLEPDAPLTETAARPSALDPTRVMPPNVPSMRAGRANQPAMGMDASPRIIEDASAAIADAKTAERLKHTHPMKVDGVPLRDMLNMIAEIGKVDIVTDNQALADAVDPNVAVTMNLNEPRPLEQILEMSLRLASPKIDYSILNGVLFVSSRAQLNQRVVTRVYEVGGADHSTLNDLLINGTGLVPRVSYVGDKLVITASELTQRHVAKLLSAVADQMSRKIAGQAANRGDGSKRTTVYGLHFADAASLKPLLLAACSSSCNLAVDGRTNSLIVNAAEDDQKLAEELIRKLDQPGKGEKASGDAGGLPDWVGPKLEALRNLSEQAKLKGLQVGAKHPEYLATITQAKVLRGELEALVAKLRKDGNEPAATKLEQELDQISTVFNAREAGAPVYRDMERARQSSQVIDAIEAELASERTRHGADSVQVRQLEARLKAVTEQMSQRSSSPATR